MLTYGNFFPNLDCTSSANRCIQWAKQVTLMKCHGCFDHIGEQHLKESKILFLLQMIQEIYIKPSSSDRGMI